MITRAQVDQLLHFQNGGYLVTSCYLNLDRAKYPPQMLKIRVKDLLQSAQRDLSAKASGHAQRESLHDDFARIEEQAMLEIGTGEHKGLAAFSCSGHNFWQVYGLPQMGRNILIADVDPYIRPLVAILGEYHRYGVLLVDRVMGQVFEVYMREIVKRADVIADVPQRLTGGGLDRRDERNVERRQEEATHQHLRRLADEAFALFKQDKFGYVVLGGHRELLREFKQHLHPYLRQRWVGDFHIEACKASPADVLTRALEIEDQVEWAHEKRMAEELVRQAESGRLAVRGVGATLGALTRGEAQTLLVEDGFEMPGYVCYDCHYPGLSEGACPHCHKALEPCPDIVDEAIELALRKNCQIEHVRGPTALRDAGRMGAMLRFQA